MTNFYTLENAKSNRSICSVCRHRIPKNAIRLKSRFIPFSCISCISTKQARGLLHNFGSFTAATQHLEDNNLISDAISCLNEKWTPTIKEMRNGPTLILTISILHDEKQQTSKFICTKLSGEEFALHFKLDDIHSTKDIKTAALKQLGMNTRSRIKLLSKSGKVLRGMFTLENFENET